MTEQKCVRIYDKNEFSNNNTEVCCVELNSYLKCGWWVVFITPRADCTEYIIEREVDNSRME